MVKLENFKLSEFDDPDFPNSGEENMCPIFLTKLDLARSIAGVPFRITSGWRSKSRNERVGGKINSSHLVGKAADIACIDSRSRFIIVKALIEAGFNRIGINAGRGFIHVDNDPAKDPDCIFLYR